jgi:hypothetical protein
MSQEKMDQLMQQYSQTKLTLSEKQKAELEREIWFQYSTAKGRGFSKETPRRSWFQSHFGGTKKEYQDRSVLMNAGPWVEPIWQRIESGLPVSTALNLIKISKNKAASSGSSNEDALKKALEEYDSIKYTCRNAAGKEFKRNAPYKENCDKPGSIGDSSEFFRQIRTLTEEFLNVRLVGIDPYLAEQAKTEFVEWIKQGYEDLRKRIMRHRRDAKQEVMAKIGRTRFVQSCEVLGIRATFGKPIDLNKAKKAKFNRVKNLHPDKNDGSHALQEEYQAVIKAYNLLEDYARQTGMTEK